MIASLRLFILLLISTFFIACQPENPLVEELEAPVERFDSSDPMQGKWTIKRHSIVVKGGAIQSTDAGYILLARDGKGEALMTHEGSNHTDAHSISWIYDQDYKTVSIDHMDGQEATLYFVKDQEDGSQVWQAPKQNEKGELEQIVEILLQK